MIEQEQMKFCPTILQYTEGPSCFPPGNDQPRRDAESY